MSNNSLTLVQFYLHFKSEEECFNPSCCELADLWENIYPYIYDWRNWLGVNLSTYGYETGDGARYHFNDLTYDNASIIQSITENSQPSFELEPYILCMALIAPGHLHALGAVELIHYLNQLFEDRLIKDCSIYLSFVSDNLNIADYIPDLHPYLPT